MSDVVRVTFFEDRAEVVRRARVEAVAGMSWVTVPGVAITIDDASLVARLSDGGRVVGVRVVRRVRQVANGSAAEIDALELEARAARVRRAAAGRALERAAGAERRAAALLEDWCAAIGRIPRGGAAEAAHWHAAHVDLVAAVRSALDQVAERRGVAERAQQDESRAALRLAQARAERPRYEAAVELQVEAAAAGPLELELSYRVACALWRPEHLARLVPAAAGTHALEITTFATVWQCTGEDWSRVNCRFSTARPAQASSPPLLSEDLVRLQKKLDRTVQVEARDLAIAVAGLDRGGRRLDEMPGVEDGGEPLWFDAERPVTIPSDGHPFRVELTTLKLPCTLDTVLYPELAPAAHVRATATLTGNRPLLAGPVRLARGGSLVGRGQIAFIGQGEPFELGFGVDDGLRVRRRVDEKRETGLLGGQKLTRIVRLYLSNLGAAPRQLTVTERIPISELEEVQIKLQSSSEDGALADKDGFVRLPVELTANSTRELELTYRVEAKAQVQLSL